MRPGRSTCARPAGSYDAAPHQHDRHIHADPDGYQYRHGHSYDDGHRSTHSDRDPDRGTHPRSPEAAYLGDQAGLAAPMLAPEPAPAPVPLGAPLPTTHRVISHTLRLRSGQAYDSLYRLITATYSTGEYYHYTYPSASLRTGDPVGDRLSLTTTMGVVNYQYDEANRLTSVNGQAYTWDENGNPSTGDSAGSPHSSGQACCRTACAPTPIPTPTGLS